MRSRRIGIAALVFVVRSLAANESGDPDASGPHSKELKNKQHKELTQQYKTASRPLGVFLIRNNKTDRVFLGCGLDLRGTMNRHKFQLSSGNHPNRELQSDWNQFGADNFAFEIIEELQPRNEPAFDSKRELEFMEKMWLDRMKPYGERGYNKPKVKRRRT